MKKNIFVALAAAFMLLFTACSKDVELPGTTWETGSIVKTVTYEGVQATVTMDVTLKFKDETNYDMDVKASINVMGYKQNIKETSTGTYTFDGEKGVLTDNDGESQPFTYNKDDKTITAVAEMEEGMSIDLVFKQK